MKRGLRPMAPGYFIRFAMERPFAANAEDALASGCPARAYFDLTCKGNLVTVQRPIERDRTIAAGALDLERDQVPIDSPVVNLRGAGAPLGCRR